MFQVWQNAFTGTLFVAEVDKNSTMLIPTKPVVALKQACD